jgi:hypothetical protein
VAQNPGVSEELVSKDELEAAIEARKELGAEMEPAVIDGCAVLGVIAVATTRSP